jgi:hypothetical protein
VKLRPAGAELHQQRITQPLEADTQRESRSLWLKEHAIDRVRILEEKESEDPGERVIRAAYPLLTSRFDNDGSSS